MMNNNNQTTTRNWPARAQAAEQYLRAASLSAAWDIYNTELTISPTAGETPYEERIICDMVGKLIRFGSISEKAADFMRSLIERIDNRAAIAAKREAEHLAAAEVPEGRISITGTVLAVKEQYTRFGSSTKMLVQHADGWKVWGTVPSGLNAERNATVTFTATVKRSDDDAKFAFFSRPVAPVPTDGIGPARMTPAEKRYESEYNVAPYAHECVF